MEEQVEWKMNKNSSTSRKCEVIGTFIGMVWWVSGLELEPC